MLPSARKRTSQTFLSRVSGIRRKSTGSCSGPCKVCIHYSMMRLHRSDKPIQSAVQPAPLLSQQRGARRWWTSSSSPGGPERERKGRSPASSPRHFLIVPSPQGRRSNASCAEITHGPSRVKQMSDGEESGNEWEREESDRGFPQRKAEIDSWRFELRLLLPPHPPPSPPYPLQLLACATLIKQDNLLSNRALPDMASAANRAEPAVLALTF